MCARYSAFGTLSIATRAIGLLLRGRIRGGEAVAGDLPRTVIALLENEEFLVGFRGGLTGRMVCRRPGRVGAHIRPGGSHLDKLGDVEFHIEFEFLEHIVICSAHGVASDRRLAVGRHEYSVLGIER